MHVAYNYLYAINFMHNVYSYIHTTLLLLCRLQNNYLTLMIHISEDTILRVDMRERPMRKLALHYLQIQVFCITKNSWYH